MSMIGELANYLLALQSVYDSVGERIYNAPAPQKTELPYITLSRISGSSYHNNGGLDGASEESWQVDCYGDLDKDAEDVKEAVRRGLDAYAGLLDTITVYSTTLETVRDLTDIEGDSSENSVHRKSMDFRIVHSEAVEDRVTTTTTTTT